VDLWLPLLSDVVERCWGHDAEAQDKNVGVWVAKWPQKIKIILSSTIAIKLYNIQIYYKN